MQKLLVVLEDQQFDCWGLILPCQTAHMSQSVPSVVLLSNEHVVCLLITSIIAAALHRCTAGQLLG
jgi:hypothetical protein